MKNMKFILLLILMAQITLAQQCYWHTYGGIGHGEDNNVGYTVGQTVTAHFAHEGDSISYGFWLVPWDAVLCVSVDDSIWQVDDGFHTDTIDVGETISMITDDVINITNCGNCWIDLGLYWDDSDTTCLELSYLPATDRAVVRAQFRNDLVRPTIYSVSNDYIKPSITWSSSSIFGPDGVEFGPPDNMRLWLQFVAPLNLETISTGFQSVPLIITTKISLP